MSIKILLLDPNSDHVKFRSQELGRSHFQESISLGISHSIRDLQFLQEKFGSERVTIELRTYDTQPVWSLLILDNKIFVQCYTKGTPGYDSKCYLISKKEASLYYAFDKHFDTIWNSSLEVENG